GGRRRHGRAARASGKSAAGQRQGRRDPSCHGGREHTWTARPAARDRVQAPRPLRHRPTPAGRAADGSGRTGRDGRLNFSFSRAYGEKVGRGAAHALTLAFAAALTLALSPHAGRGKTTSLLFLFCPLGVLLRLLVR